MTKSFISGSGESLGTSSSAGGEQAATISQATLGRTCWRDGQINESHGLSEQGEKETKKNKGANWQLGSLGNHRGKDRCVGYCGQI